MRSFLFFFYCTTMFRLFTNASTTLPLTDRPAYWERPGCGSVFSVSRGGGQDSLLNAGQISPAPSPPAVYLSLKGLDSGKYHQKLKCLPDPLRLIWKCCGSSWELICPWIVDISLDRADVVKYLNHFFFCLFGFLRAEVKHKPRWLQIGFKKKNTSQHVSFFYTYICVENICAVVYMVLVKCVWMPTPSYATKSKDVLKSFLGTLQCLFIHSCISNK